MMYTDTSTDTHTHTSHGYLRCMLKGMYALDVCLGIATLRKILFSKNYEQHHSNIFLNKLWDQNPIDFPLIFINKNLNEF
jgi:hypothetical protein